MPAVCRAALAVVKDCAAARHRYHPDMKTPELITAYCLAYHHWTVVPHHMAEDFAEMRDCGFTAVALSFCESEMRYARRAFELQVELAHAAGLKVFVVPSRLGGRFAGAPLMAGTWITQHPEAAVPGLAGFAGPVACVESPAFREWIAGFMTTLLTDYPLDGIIWDEPKSVQQVSRHPDTLRRFGPNPTASDMCRGFCEFLDWLVTHCHQTRPRLVQTLFAQNTDPEEFTAKAAKIAGLTYHGYDGNLSRESFFHEEPSWQKYRIEKPWPRTVRECTAAGKKTFALVENMLLPAVAHAEYEANLANYLAGPLPDHLALYYYAHNNEDPEAVQDITRRLMRQLRR
jgi:hypothetical protein